jgi:hypothetical protein
MNTNTILREIAKIKVRSHYIYLINIYSRAYLAWYVFINKELKVPCTKEKILNKLYQLSLKSMIGRVYATEECILVLKAPQVTRNNIGFHKVDGPAIRWPEYNVHFINGRKMTEELYNSVLNEQYTLEMYLKEENEDLKSAIIALMQEVHGDEHVYNFFNNHFTKINTYTDKKDKRYLVGTEGMNIGVYTLYKGEVNNTKVAYVRCFCPSTDRMFTLGVDNKHTNAKDAIASLYRVPNKLKSHIKHIRRQGERFVTVFTDKGTKILSGLSKEEISATVSITGNEYFSKMQYEY